MRDIYVKTSVGVGSIATPCCVAAPGTHLRGNLAGFSISRILDVPEAVSEALAVFTFNACDVKGHTVRWEQLQLGRGREVCGIGRRWDPAKEFGL